MTTKRRPRAKELDPFGRAVLALADYLESDGWSVVLFTGSRVQRQPGGRKTQYEFVLRFSGGPTTKQAARVERGVNHATGRIYRSQQRGAP